MKKWRVIVHDACDGAWNMAVDYALLNSGVPTLRLYRWAKPTITIGYFQDIEKEVYIQRCHKDGVEVIRRITGGGAVFHHEEITYSLVLPLKGRYGYGTIVDSYKRIAEPLIVALNTFGIHAQYKPINDIIVGNRKISGSAQTRKDGKILQHGTILIATDTEKMFYYLKLEPKKHTTNNEKPVITVCELIDMPLNELYNHMIAKLIQAFAATFAVDFQEADITKDEQKKALHFVHQYFGFNEWNQQRIMSK